MKAIELGQRVQLIGSMLLGTTRHKWSVKDKGVTVTKFQVKWDTGGLGTVNENDIEPYTIKSYKYANA